MSKDLFMLMREQEASEIIKSDFTKKHAIAKGKEWGNKLREQGLINPTEAFINTNRLCDTLNSFKDDLKYNLPKEKVNMLGMEISPLNGRKMINFSDDPVWCEIKKQLESREAVLKMALYSDEPIFTEEGEVPKVSISYSKDSLVVKY
jgi:hypothetical protein